MYKKQIIGVILGLAMGLPQGLDEISNFFQVETLPHGTVYGTIAFGLCGCFLVGLALLNPNTKNFGPLSNYIDKYVDMYFLMMVGTLSIGIPIMYRVGLSDPFASSLHTGWFFFSGGIGLALAGIGKYLWKRT